MNKSTGLMLVVLSPLAACSNQVHPLSIAQIVALGPAADLTLNSCVITEKPEIITGSAKVDVAAGDPQVNVGIRLTGTGYLNNGLELKTGEILEPANQNTPVLTAVVINYRLSRRLGATPRTFTQPILVTFTVGVELSVRVPVPLLSQEIGQQLFDGLTPSAALDDFVDINVDIEFRGEMSSSRTPFSSGVVTFPIRAVRSLPATTCPAGQRFQRYPNADKDGIQDLCNYVGTTYNPTSGFAPPPGTCCDATIPAGAPGFVPGC